MLWNHPQVLPSRGGREEGRSSRWRPRGQLGRRPKRPRSRGVLRRARALLAPSAFRVPPAASSSFGKKAPGFRKKASQHLSSSSSSSTDRVVLMRPCRSRSSCRFISTPSCPTLSSVHATSTSSCPTVSPTSHPLPRPPPSDASASTYRRRGASWLF